MFFYFTVCGCCYHLKVANNPKASRCSVRILAAILSPETKFLTGNVKNKGNSKWIV